VEKRVGKLERDDRVKRGGEERRLKETKRRVRDMERA